MDEIHSKNRINVLILNFLSLLVSVSEPEPCGTRLMIPRAKAFCVRSMSSLDRWHTFSASVPVKLLERTWKKEKMTIGKKWLQSKERHGKEPPAHSLSNFGMQGLLKWFCLKLGTWKSTGKNNQFLATMHFFEINPPYLDKPSVMTKNTGWFLEGSRMAYELS